jgi:hypothetical protein
MTGTDSVFTNPLRPGAGHMPPYLAGRQTEIEEFGRLLTQDVILENLVLTGLRGVGKTVLLDTFKPLAIQIGWLWVGTDLSESMSLTEDRITTRLIADLSLITSSLTVASKQISTIGFQPSVKRVDYKLDYELIRSIYDQTPGMASDKIKNVLEFAWRCLKSNGMFRGLVFAYDEAQNLSDHTAKEEYPLSLLLDVFQSIQKKNIPFMLALTGLPTLFPKLVEARTFAERMFHIIFLDRLDEDDSRDAIQKPIEDTNCPLSLSEGIIQPMIRVSGGYPYFIQFLGREVYDVVLQQMKQNKGVKEKRIYRVPFDEIIRKLDTDFFAGRWAKATDRQRALLTVISHLDNCDSEFSVQEIAEKALELLEKPFSPSHINQMLGKLGDAGLVYKNRHGKYSFAVPLLGKFIGRQNESATSR